MTHPKHNIDLDLAAGAFLSQFPEAVANQLLLAAPEYTDRWLRASRQARERIDFTASPLVNDLHALLDLGEEILLRHNVWIAFITSCLKESLIPSVWHDFFVGCAAWYLPPAHYSILPYRNIPFSLNDLMEFIRDPNYHPSIREDAVLVRLDPSTAAEIGIRKIIQSVIESEPLNIVRALKSAFT